MAVPSHFLCPLSNVLMKEPMIDSSALRKENKWQERQTAYLSYEKSAILSKLEDDSKNGRRSYCPVSGLPLSLDSLVLNKELEWKIKYWAKKNYGSFEKAVAAVGAIAEDNQLSLSNSSSSSMDFIDSFAPHQFICPLSRTVMDDPVRSRDGSASFERATIIRWLDSAIEAVCPITDQLLTREDLVRNDALAEEIQEWKNRLKRSE